jgi:hypothetical protein
MIRTFGICVGFGLSMLLSGTASAQYVGSGHSSTGSYGTGSNPSGHYVRPHSNSNGTFTQGHHRSNSNSTQLDNYGTIGNVNPYTGAPGTRAPRY